MVVAEKTATSGKRHSVRRLLARLKGGVPDDGDAALRSALERYGPLKCRIHGDVRLRRRRTAAENGEPSADEFELANESEMDLEAESEFETEGEEFMADMKGKHIHPCICDMTRAQLKKIDAYLRAMRLRQVRYMKRVKEIEEELARLEEERLERERELQEQQELFGDEYEMVGRQRKRKKRSARRASMVSLGVKQVINWRKQPRIAVKPTRASLLRGDYTKYCDAAPAPLGPVRAISIGDEPKIKVRLTAASTLRTRVNYQKRKTMEENEDTRYPFITPYFV